MSTSWFHSFQCIRVQEVWVHIWSRATHTLLISIDMFSESGWFQLFSKEQGIYHTFYWRRQRYCSTYLHRMKVRVKFLNTNNNNTRVINSVANVIHRVMYFLQKWMLGFYIQKLRSPQMQATIPLFKGKWSELFSDVVSIKTNYVHVHAQNTLRLGGY